MNSLEYFNRSAAATIQETVTVFSIIHVEYRAVALLLLFCGSGVSSV